MDESDAESIEQRARTRANLLPEEEQADSADAREQAREVLRESDERSTLAEDGAADDVPERRSSEEAV